MRIIKLNQRLIRENIERLIEIDSIIIDEEGTWTLDNFLMELNHKWDYSFAMLVDDQIVGFIICSVKGNSLYIHRLAVLPEYQGKKIGSTLLKYICEICLKQNMNSVTLQVKKFNIEAQRFYERHGFERIGSNGPNYVYKKVIR